MRLIVETELKVSFLIMGGVDWIESFDLPFCLQLFDIDTTVDPSYVISLIRKLLPIDSSSEERDRSTEIRHNYDYDMNASNAVQGVVPRSGDGFVEGGPEGMDIGDNRKESTSEKNEKVSSCREPEKLRGSSVEEEAWEEHGCVLWDLAANETHAELMVIIF